jgi:transposase-like protein
VIRSRREVGHGRGPSRVSPALDGETSGRASSQYLKGETSAQAAARKHGLTVAEVEDWRDRFLLGAENARRARPKDEEALKDEQIKKLKQKVGELVLDLDVLKEATKDRPFVPKTSDE